jgi:soluble lytic murein transglycosylase
VIVGACVVAVLYGGLVVLRALYPADYLPLVLVAAESEGLDPALVCAVIRAESRFRPDVVSPRGAIGLMQIMPETGASIAVALGVDQYSVVDLAVPEVNIRFGTWYLRRMLDRFGSIETALIAYNAGPTRAASWAEAGGAAFAETTAYVRRVLRAIPIYRIYLRCPMLVQIVPSLPF